MMDNFLFADRTSIILSHPEPQAIFMITVFGLLLAGKQFDLPLFLFLHLIFSEECLQTDDAVCRVELATNVWVLEIDVGQLLEDF